MKTLSATKLLTTGLLIAVAAIGVAGHRPAPVARSIANKCSAKCASNSNHSAAANPAAKMVAGMAHGQTCASIANTSGVEIEPAGAESAASQKFGVEAKRITVSSLVDRALADQMRLLLARKADIERWDRPAQVHFFRWFGTVNSDARAMIYQRIHIETLLNKEYSVGNFRRAVPSRPGLFAFVKPTDPSKVFVDQQFVRAPRIGENSRAGTISHEMSHFVLAGGTQDFVYGTADCGKLARSDSAKALNNADNFEFYVEGVR